jgi:hypothetical protein
VQAAVVPAPVEYEPRGQRPPVEAAHAEHPVVNVRTAVHAADVAPCVAYAPALHEPDGVLKPPAHHWPAGQGVHVPELCAA